MRGQAGRDIEPDGFEEVGYRPGVSEGVSEGQLEGHLLNVGRFHVCLQAASVRPHQGSLTVGKPQQENRRLSPRRLDGDPQARADGLARCNLTAFLRAISATGARPPLCIEVFSDTLMALPVHEAASRLFKTLDESASAAGYPI